MSQLDKIEQDVLEALAAGLPMPFLVLDHFGHIRVATLSAKSMLNIHSEDMAFFDLFDAAEHEKIQSTFLTQTNFNFSKSVYLQLTLSTKDVIKGEFNISPYRSPAGEMYVLITIYNTATDLVGGKSVRLTISDDELLLLSGDLGLSELVKEIKGSYPFTFLSKTRVAQKINLYEGALWIKNEVGNYVLVNEKFAASFMMKPSGIEGKNEMNFLPLYLQSFYASIQKHIELTHNVITLEGSVLLGSKSNDGLQTVLLPLVDASGNFRGVIGFTRKIQIENPGVNGNRSQTALAEIVDDLPFASGIFDNSGKLVLYNQNYRNVFESSRPVDTLESLGYSKEIEEFKSDNSRSILDIEFYSNGFNTKKARLIKTSYVDGLLFILEDDNTISLENLLKHRGKMHEQLFKYNPEPIITYYKDSFKFIDCNQKSIELYGYTLDEFNTMDFTDLYSPSDLQELRSGFEVDEGKFSAPQLHRRKDGTTVSVSLFRIPFMYEGKKAHYCLIKDLSSDKSVQINQMVYNDLFENSELPLLLLDDIRFIKKINNKAYELFGKPQGSLLEEAFYSLIDDKSRVDFSGVTNKNKPIQTKAVLRVITPQGFVPKTFNVVPITLDGRVAEYYLLIGEPPTGEIIVKEVIKEVIKEIPVERIIEKPVEKIVYREGAANGNSQPVNGINSSQIGYIFHELNTPMNAILGFVDLVKSSLPSLDEEQEESFQIIDQNKSKFKLTVNSVGEYSRVIEDLRSLTVAKSTFSFILDSLLRDNETSDPLFWREVVPGRISGLEIETDVEKLKSFLKTILMMTFLSNESEKVTVSFSQIDEQYYMISLKDGGDKVSEKTLQAIQSVFNGADIYVLRSIGFSRFNVYTVQKLLKALQGRFETKMVSGKPAEIGFIFPIKLDSASYQADLETDDFGNALKSVSSTKSFVQSKVDNENQKQVVEPTSFSGSVTPATDDSFDSFSRYSFTNSFSSESSNEIAPTINKTFEKNESFTTPTREEKPLFKDTPPAPVPMESSEKQVAVSYSDDSPIKLSDLSCLYVEDSVDAQILFRQQCKELKLIKFAASFEEAMPLFQEFSFDFILLDINLQGEYNGLDALKIIRQIPGYSNKPIIGASAYVLPGDRDKFISAGFSAFIEKPVYKTTLTEKLSKLKK